MNKLEKAFSTYLQDIGYLDFVYLGDDKDDIKDKDVNPVTEKESQSLINNLSKSQEQNNSIVTIILIMLCILFTVGIFFVFYYRDDPVTLCTIFGGNFFALLGIVSKLKKIWTEKVIIEYSQSILKDLKPEEAAKVMMTLYTNIIRKN
ncbi:MAG: hypothetical protein OMM_08279 [Candidatus Magnetoglobus multicellularis str. Araruama]|uniref:Uncharacterized protein n=1 Tax=Candidatus Magnetoglobus multicellularis str. Araruama TaxID=890399 RepID=A0A1V1P8L1_9BACT|nr:MAG: hypothetical protein OMM_08279 [Candidatus Magnetoglobus multicellularis str. Araruama]